MLLSLPDRGLQNGIIAALQEKNLPCTYRLFPFGGGLCLALLGTTEAVGTDQFLRSVVYALQKACGEDIPFPDILETRLVPDWFDLYSETGCGASQRENGEGEDFLEKYNLRLASRASFGSGLHPSTRSAILLLEDFFGRENLLAGRILDVGCGSGILSFVCARLGAASVHGVDRDPEAVQAARQNSAANKLETVFTVDDTPMKELQQTYDLVVANLAVSVLHGLLRPLCRLVVKEGVLVLSGFQTGQGSRIRKNLTERGFAVVSERSQEGWLAFSCQRRKGMGA